jgi:hypothetical protein
LSGIFRLSCQKLGKTRNLKTAYDLHDAAPETFLTLGEVHSSPKHVSRNAEMGQVIRQIGMVIGLTVVLTFPVTMVSGAGSQKHTGHVIRDAGTTLKLLPQARGVSTGVKEPRMHQNR